MLINMIIPIYEQYHIRNNTVNDGLDVSGIISLILDGDSVMKQAVVYGIICG